MLLRTFAGDAEVVHLLAPLAAAADEDRTSDPLDCADAARVQILVFALDQAGGSSNVAALQHSDELDAHDALDTPASIDDATADIADDDDGTIVGWDFVPTKRYVHVTIDKDVHQDTNEHAIALVYRKERPVTHGAGVSITSLGNAADAQ